jgi:hypothetical protein
MIAWMAKSPKASAIVDTRVIYCGDNLKRPRKLPEVVYIDLPSNSNRNYEVFGGEMEEKLSFLDQRYR